MAEPRIVEAVASGIGRKRDVKAAKINAAYVAAIEEAILDGIALDDRAEIMKRKNEKADVVRLEFAIADAEAMAQFEAEAEAAVRIAAENRTVPEGADVAAYQAELDADIAALALEIAAELTPGKVAEARETFAEFQANRDAELSDLYAELDAAVQE